MFERIELVSDIGKEVKQMIAAIDRKRVENIYLGIKKEVGANFWNEFNQFDATKGFETFEDGKKKLITLVSGTLENFREHGEGLEIE
jgi:collagenase-like PrtC family protease